LSRLWVDTVSRAWFLAGKSNLSAWANTLGRHAVPGYREEELGISWGKLSGSKRTRRQLVELALYKAMLAARRIEHQIEAATLDAFVCHLHTEYRVIEQLLE
jgi:hypothetical protein